MQARRTTERRTNTTGGRRNALVLAGLALPLLIGFYVLVLASSTHPASGGPQLRLDQFLTLVGKGQGSSATILSGEDTITGALVVGQQSLFAHLSRALEAGGAPTTVRRQPLKALVGPVSTLLPMLILGDLIVVVALLARSGASLVGAFGRAGARGAGEDASSPALTFANVPVADEAVEERAVIVDYLADPSRFAAMGAAVPQGALLSGPPGRRKTRLARAVAGETGGLFLPISGSDFLEMFVGVRAARIRDFATAAATALAIVLADVATAADSRRPRPALVPQLVSAFSS